MHERVCRYWMWFSFLSLHPWILSRQSLFRANLWSNHNYPTTHNQNEVLTAVYWRAYSTLYSHTTFMLFLSSSVCVSVCSCVCVCFFYRAFPILYSQSMWKKWARILTDSVYNIKWKWMVHSIFIQFSLKKISSFCFVFCALFLVRLSFA